MALFLKRVAFIAALIVAWDLVVRLGEIPTYVFPSPLEVGKNLWTNLASGSLPLAILISMKRLFIGYGLSVLAGVPLGIALGRIPALSWSVGTLIVGLQALPSICWLPLALLWFGLSENAILFVVLLGALMSIVTATEDAIRTVPPNTLRAARMMGARGHVLYFRVLLPAAFPGILTGLKLGWIFAWRALMAGELLFVAGGIGQYLHTGRELNDMAQVLAAMVSIIALGLAFDRLILGRIESQVRARWGLDRS
ncbi:MAG: ABC transporter permease [Myxococcales bacterium]|nr:ABC transporter permease [Myxococcales bacterium]